MKKNVDKFNTISKQMEVGSQAIKKMYDLQTELLRLNE